MPRNQHSQQANHKGVKITHTPKGWMVHTNIRPKYYSTLTQARQAIDRWETRQYKRDKRIWDIF